MASFSVVSFPDPALSVVRGKAIIGHVPKKISVCSLYLTLGRVDRLSSNRIQTLLWGFSAWLSVFTLDLKLFCAPHARIKNGKFRTENFFIVLIFRILEFYVKYAKFCTIRNFPAIRYSISCINLWCEEPYKLSFDTLASSQTAFFMRALHPSQKIGDFH